MSNPSLPCTAKKKLSRCLKPSNSLRCDDTHEWRSHRQTAHLLQKATKRLDRRIGSFRAGMVIIDGNERGGEGAVTARLWMRSFSKSSLRPQSHGYRCLLRETHGTRAVQWRRGEVPTMADLIDSLSPMCLVSGVQMVLFEICLRSSSPLLTFMALLKADKCFLGVSSPSGRFMSPKNP